MLALFFFAPPFCEFFDDAWADIYQQGFQGAQLFAEDTPELLEVVPAIWLPEPPLRVAGELVPSPVIILIDRETIAEADVKLTEISTRVLSHAPPQL